MAKVELRGRRAGRRRTSGRRAGDGAVPQREARSLVHRHLEASDPARPRPAPASPTDAAPPRAGRATRLLSGIVLCCLAAPAAAETWSERAGACDEWAGTWTVTEARPGVWTGTATQRKVGGSCAPADGRILTGAVEAVVSGDRFSARKLHMPGIGDCSYTGTIDGDRISGTYVCPPSADTFSFTLRK